MDEDLEETEGKGAIMFEKERLSYIGKDCRLLPPVLAKLYGRQTRRLDLSFNCLVSLSGLEKFEFLEELVLDNNCLSDSIRIPSLLHLHTLSLNKNKITNLELVLSQLSEKVPALSYLSLLGNPACPDQLSDCELEEQDYLTYRIYVLYRVPGLRFLDSRAVDTKEREDARTKGRFMRIVRPANNPSDEDSEDVGSVYSPLPGVGTGTAIGTRTTIRTGTAIGTGAYGKCRYRYSGKNSEGNRFISNNDL